MKQDLFSAARQARERAYAPYSKFAVGAALEASDGAVYLGCNVENASYGATLCAERAAFGAAIAAGAREFTRIAIVGGMAGEAPSRACMPCGICRQVMRELCGDDFEILVKDGEQTRTYPLQALLPSSFSGDSLEA